MFGSPCQILTDNGREFNNEDFRIMGEKLTTKIKSTAAESPWSNNIKIMPCVEGDRSDCQPEASSIARSRRLRATVVVKG